MQITTETVITTDETSAGDEVAHWTRAGCECNDPNTALCGHDVTHERYLTDDEAEDALFCVVCEELDYCPGCGSTDI